MTDPTGVRESDEAVDAAASSVPAHPRLTYDGDSVLRELDIPKSLVFPLSNIHGDTREEGTLAFTHDRQHYHFSFRAREDGYVLTYVDVVRAVRGDVESVTHYRRENEYQIQVMLPFMSMSDEECAAARTRFTEWRQNYEQRREVHRAETRARHARAVEEREAWVAQWRKAEARANETLRRFLSEDQRQEMDLHGYFTVVGSAGTVFRIITENGEVSGNVQWVDGQGVTRGRICAHCTATYDPETRDSIQVPAADHYLTQLLEITADEPGWLRIAHPFDRDMPPTLCPRWDAAHA